MSISPGWSAEEIREFVYEYERQPFGTKRAWLAERDITPKRFERWRATVFDGDLDKALVPRQSGGMTSVSQRRQAARVRAAGEAELERLQERVRELEMSNEALGKAIGLLHATHVQEPDETPSTPTRSSS